MPRHQTNTLVFEISSNSLSYGLDDEIDITVFVYNPFDYSPENAVFELSIAFMDRGERYFVVEESLSLGPHERISVKPGVFGVTENMPPGQYKALALLGAPGGNFRASEFLLFNITEGNMTRATNPGFLEMHICGDEECKKGEIKVFTAGEPIHILMDGDPSLTLELRVNGTVYTSDPIYFESLPIGTHEVIVEASYETNGTRARTIRDYIGIIERHPEIRDASLCNGDFQCNNGEDYRNCPTDCIKSGEKGNTWPYAGIAVLLFFLAIIFILFITKGK
jgi:hypothetical protein